MVKKKAKRKTVSELEKVRKTLEMAQHNLRQMTISRDEWIKNAQRERENLLNTEATGEERRILIDKLTLEKAALVATIQRLSPEIDVAHQFISGLLERLERLKAHNRAERASSKVKL